MSHKDYFGNQVKLGDVLLGAKAGGKFFDTQFTFCVVIGTTPKLARVHQVYTSDPTTLNKTEVLEQVKTRRGKKGGKVCTVNFIKTTVNLGITEVEVEAALEAYKTETLQDPWAL